MILTVPLASGTTLANVRYRWLTVSGPGSELSSGITQQIADFPVFTIDVGTPPSDAQELIVYDTTDHGNWNAAGYLIASRLDVAVSSRSSHSAADVWAVGTRTLTGFGTLVADVTTAVWAAATRTLTAFGFAVNTNANATETAIKAKTDNLPAVPASEGNVSAVGLAVLTRAVPGDAMTLTSGERTSIGTAVWASATRTLTGFGTLVADIWSAVTRTLTSGGGATVDEIADRIIADHGAGSYATTAGGSGAYLVTVTVTDEDDNPLQNATVRLSEGINAFTVMTDVDGVATFNLDAATYALGIAKDGYQFTPATIVVTGDGNFDAQLTRFVPPTPGLPSQCACYLTTRDGHGAAQTSVKLTFTLVSAPIPDSYETGAMTATSDSDGLLTIDLRKGAKYKGQRGENGKEVFFDVPNADSFQLPQVLGDP